MMLHVDQEDLASAVAKTAEVASKRATLPILGNLLLEASEGQLVVTGTDLDVTVRVTVPAAVARPGKLTLPADLLKKAVARMRGHVAIEQHESGMPNAFIGAKGTEIKLLGASHAGYPEIPGPDKVEQLLAVPGKTLDDLLAVTERSMSADESRPNLNGIHLQLRKGRLTAMSTDSHRLSRSSRAVDLEEEAALQDGIIVPSRATKVLHRLVQGVETIRLGGVDMGRSGLATLGMLAATVGRTEVFVRLIDAAYPDLRQVIPKRGGEESLMRVKSAELRDAVRTCGVVASERLHGVRVTLQADHLELTSNNKDLGQASATCPATVKAGPGFSVGHCFAANTRYLLDVLGAAGDGEVCLALANPLSPLLVTVPDNDDDLWVVMPMRIQPS